jgi:hypothetical protein
MLQAPNVPHDTGGEESLPKQIQGVSEETL